VGRQSTDSKRNEKRPESKPKNERRRSYEPPAVIYRGRLEAHAVTSCNVTTQSGCSIPC
jgi:hypothetical protein